MLLLMRCGKENNQESSRLYMDWTAETVGGEGEKKGNCACWEEKEEYGGGMWRGRQDPERRIGVCREGLRNIGGVVHR